MTTAGTIPTGSTSSDVRFDSEGFLIAGTLTQVPAPVAAALVLTGSGRLDRDSDAKLHGLPLLRTGVTRQVAEALNAARVVTLRYDKRGVGASGGDERPQPPLAPGGTTPPYPPENRLCRAAAPATMRQHG